MISESFAKSGFCTTYWIGCEKPIAPGAYGNAMTPEMPMSWGNSPPIICWTVVWRSPKSLRMTPMNALFTPPANPPTIVKYPLTSGVRPMICSTCRT